MHKLTKSAPSNELQKIFNHKLRHPKTEDLFIHSYLACTTSSAYCQM